MTPPLLRLPAQWTPADWTWAARAACAWADPATVQRLAFWGWLVTQRGQHPDYWDGAGESSGAK